MPQNPKPQLWPAKYVIASDGTQISSQITSVMVGSSVHYFHVTAKSIYK